MDIVDWGVKKKCVGRKRRWTDMQELEKILEEIEEGTHTFELL